jgi:hypothetical protein
MKNKYKLLDDLVESVFAVEIGLSEESCTKLYGRMLENSDWRAEIAAELSLALSDDSFSWKQFFDEHDLYSAVNESDARRYAEQIFREPFQSYGSN